MKQKSNKAGKTYLRIFRGTGYLLLVTAAFCTMIPLLWLFTSSFKTANEIFAVPIQWLPSFPPRIATSPYVLENAYPNIQKPAPITAERWNALYPQLTAAIWNRTETYITEDPHRANYVHSEALKNEVVQGLWQQLIAQLPESTWDTDTETLLMTVQDAIIPETLDTVWGTVYREIALGVPQIEDLDFNRTPLEAIAWAPATGTVIRPSPHESTSAHLSYGFQDSDTAQITATLTSPIPIDRIRRITIPLRGDASYHRVALSVVATEPNRETTYRATRPFVVTDALWKDTVWRLHGIPGELETAHITMEKSDARPTHTAEGASRLSLQLTIHQPPYLAIVWDKFTSNYRNLWKTVPYGRYFVNSVFIATASTLLTLFFCSLGGYAFAKYRFRGQKILFGILLASMMVPFQVLLVPLFGLMYDIGWLNSYKAIVIPFSVGAFGVFLMRQFIVTIPTELLDAARIDGCSEFGIYYRIVLPIIKPALGALTIYSFLGSWNGYLWPLIILRDEAKYTLPIGLANLVGVYRQDYGMLMAGTLLSLMPIVILFLAMQREFVQGITLGGVKE